MFREVMEKAEKAVDTYAAFQNPLDRKDREMLCLLGNHLVLEREGSSTRAI